MYSEDRKFFGVVVMVTIGTVGNTVDAHSFLASITTHNTVGLHTIGTEGNTFGETFDHNLHTFLLTWFGNECLREEVNGWWQSWSVAWGVPLSMNLL